MFFIILMPVAVLGNTVDELNNLIKKIEEKEK